MNLKILQLGTLFFLFLPSLGEAAIVWNKGQWPTSWQNSIASEIRYVLSLTDYRDYTVTSVSYNYIVPLYRPYEFTLESPDKKTKIRGSLNAEHRSLYRFDVALKQTLSGGSYCNLDANVRKDVATFELEDDKYHPFFQINGTHPAHGKL